MVWLEIVRGEIFKSFSQEVPYSTYVEINTFKNEEKILRIEGYIYVETEIMTATRFLTT